MTKQGTKENQAAATIKKWFSYTTDKVRKHRIIFLAAFLLLIIIGSGVATGLYVYRNENRQSNSDGVSLSPSSEVVEDDSTPVKEQDIPSTGGNSSSGNNGLSEQEKCNQDEVLNKYKKVDYSKLSYRLRTDGTPSPKPGDKLRIFEQDGKGNTHLSVGPIDKSFLEEIHFDNVTYMKDTSDGTWQVSNEEESSNYTTPPVTIRCAEYSYKNEGQKPCGKLTCFEYTISRSSNPPGTMSQLFIDTKDFLFQSSNYGDTYISEGNYMEYMPITITKPSPIK